MSRHLMLPETGRAKFSAKVFEFLRFMAKQYHKPVSTVMCAISLHGTKKSRHSAGSL
jgi:hypothetical protein